MLYTQFKLMNEDETDRKKEEDTLKITTGGENGPLLHLTN